MESARQNITVAVRVRPLSPKEICTEDFPDGSSDFLPVAKCPRKLVSVVDERVIIFGIQSPFQKRINLADPVDKSQKQQRTYTHGTKRRQEIRYTFDKVFNEDASQQQVFEATSKPLISGVLDGYNATVFAYGATGCGKTHTITGMC